nr:MAG TPA: hypothetical protein [Bacteriophage sp.]
MFPWVSDYIFILIRMLCTSTHLSLLYSLPD